MDKLLLKTLKHKADRKQKLRNSCKVPLSFARTACFHLDFGTGLFSDIH